MTVDLLRAGVIRGAPAPLDADHRSRVSIRINDHLGAAFSATIPGAVSEANGPTTSAQGAARFWSHPCKSQDESASWAPNAS